MGCPPVRKIIHSLKLVDYLHVQADNPWYNYYIANKISVNVYKLYKDSLYDNFEYLFTKVVYFDS